MSQPPIAPNPPISPPPGVTHGGVSAPTNAPLDATRATGLDKLPGGKVFTQSTTGNAVVDGALNAIGNFVGVGIGLVFITIGIAIIILNNDKVQDAGRKITGAAAALNPELAGVAIATNVVTGKKARGENVQQVFNNKAKADKAKNAATAKQDAAIRKTNRAQFLKPVQAKPARQSFSVPVVETRTVPEQRSARGAAMPTNTAKFLPTSPRVERPE